MFGEGGWDALLAVYVFGAAGRTLSAGELCRATTETSMTSALRLQRRLVDLGFLRRVDDPADRRRVLVELTPDGLRILEEYIDFLVAQRLAPGNEDDAGNPQVVEYVYRHLSGT